MTKTAYLLGFLGLVFAAAPGCSISHPDPQPAIDHYVTGQMLYDKGDYAAALAELRKAIAADPNLSVAQSAAGDIYRKQGNYDMARHCYEQACAANPYAFRPHYNLGVVYQFLAEAATTAEQVQEQLTKAAKAYLRALTIKDNDFDTNLNLSACYFQMGKLDLATQYCNAAIEIDPKSAAAKSNLGIIYDQQQKYSDAIRLYNESLELDAHQPQILLNLGATYMRQSRWARAIHTFEVASREMPKDSAPYEQIAACHYYEATSSSQVSAPDEDKAIASYQKALEMNPKSAPAYRGLGVVHMGRFLRDRSQTQLRDQALEFWHKSLELQSNQDDLAKLIEKYQPKSAVPNL